jgi:hypothetical protein
MSFMTKQHWLVIVLSDERTLSLLASDPAPQLTVAGDVYRAAGAGEVSATFDRLLTADGRFVGVQIWLERAQAHHLLAKIPRSSYLSISEDPPTLEVFFVDADRELAGIESAGEQSLVGQVYVSERGRLAVGIDLAELLTSEHDYEVVKQANANWVTPSK